MTQPTELQVLKARATQLNIPFSANIGLDTLKAKVHAFLNDLPEPVEKGEPAPVRTVKTNPNLYVPTESPLQAKARKRREANRLVRVRVMNRNPAMKDYVGDWYCVSNSVVGDIRKFVAYDTEDGFHVPYMIYLHLLEKEYQVFTETKDSKGRPKVNAKNVKELSVELLDPLTEDEMADLKVRQINNKSID